MSEPRPTSSEMEKVARKKIEERARCKRDKLFLSEVMGWEFQPDVHQELFDQFIQFDSKKMWQDQSPIKNRLVLWSRGHYKSTAIQVEIVQAILNNPDVTILIMRGGITVTQTWLKEIKAYFTGQNPNSRLRELFPEFCADELGNKNEFTVPARINKGIAQATVTVASPNAITTSQHYDVMFFDDLIHAKNYRSQTQLQKVEEDFSGFFPLLNPGGYRYVTGTRYAHGELYEKLIMNNVNNEWKISVKTCWSDDGINPRFPERTITKPNGTTKKIGFTKEMLLGILRDDPELYASQYMNQPAAMGSARFTEEIIDGSLVDDEKVTLSFAVMFVDLASSENEKADDSVVTIGRNDGKGSVYLADFVGGQWAPEILASAVIKMSMKHRPLRILLEDTASCKYFVEYLRLRCRELGINLPLEFMKVDTQKDAKNVRINLLASVMRGRRFRILRSCVMNPRWETLKKQLIRWEPAKERRNSRHDDYPDTMSFMARELGTMVLNAPPQTDAQSDPILKMVREAERQAAWERSMTEPEETPVGGGGDYIAW